MQNLEAHAEPGSLFGAELDAEQLDLLRDEESGKLPANVFRMVRKSATSGPGRPKGAINRKTEQLSRLVIQKYGDPVLGAAEIYAMPLDQLVEALLIADGSKAREDRLLEMLGRAEKLMERLADNDLLTGPALEGLEQLSVTVGKLAQVAASLKSKPGELALKALNTQLQARRDVAPFCHSKLPVAVDVTMRPDVILNIPGLTDTSSLVSHVNRANISDEDLNRLEYMPEGQPDDLVDVTDGDGGGDED